MSRGETQRNHLRCDLRGYVPNSNLKYDMNYINLWFILFVIFFENILYLQFLSRSFRMLSLINSTSLFGIHTIQIFLTHLAVFNGEKTKGLTNSKTFFLKEITINET